MFVFFSGREASGDDVLQGRNYQHDGSWEEQMRAISALAQLEPSLENYQKLRAHSG
jgi:hypothetical protein